jgi:hypothetical protein
MTILRANVLDSVHFDLENNLPVIEVQGCDLPTVDEHAIEKGLKCRENVLLMDLKTALLVTWVGLLDVEDIHSDVE